MAPKNILLLVADDLGLYVGTYGCPSVQTPHLDRLASQGIKFDHSFSATPSCSGSRSVIYTGLHTHENGQYGLQMGKNHFQTFEHVDTAPKLLNHAGYLTGIVGKVHVGTEAIYPWTVREESESRDVRWVSERCGAFLERSKAENRPFFLTVGFIDPHRDITTRGGFGNEEIYPGVQELDIQAQDVEVPSWLCDLPQVRQELVEYYKAIYRMDQGVGFILQQLKEKGLEDETLVIFTSDNGPPFINSKTTLYDAGIHLPLIVRHPGSTEAGGVINPNMISYVDFVPTILDYAGIDLNLKLNPDAPTRRGRSFLPIIEATDVLPDDQWAQHIFGSHTFHELQNYYPARYLRDRKYKYHRNIAWRLDFPFATDLYASLTYEAHRNQAPVQPDGDGTTGGVLIGKRSLHQYLFRPPEELYDLENDPDEIINLAEDPAHKERLVGMRKKLERWQYETGDVWLFRDGVSMKILERHTGSDLKIPDRFDVNTQQPGTEGVETVAPGHNFARGV